MKIKIFGKTKLEIVGNLTLFEYCLDSGGAKKIVRGHPVVRRPRVEESCSIVSLSLGNAI
jgi:hypothetical protein